jgi:nucleoside-diphosphate-sugar epimerase
VVCVKVILAGASGAIGRAVVAELRRRGHEVIGVARSAGGAEIIRGLGAQPVVADVLDRDGLLRALDGLAADTVIHEATALKHAPTHYRGRGITATNRLRTTGTGHLLEAARLVGAERFVTQSMIFGYGFVDHGEAPITEDAPFGQPRGSRADPATAALGSAEQQASSAQGIEGVALRYGFLYGPGPASARIVRMLRARVFPIPRGGGGTFGWVYVDDAAAATVAALERGRAGQAYNIVDDQPATWGEVFDAMAQALGAPRPIRMPGRLIRLAAPFLAAQMIDTSMRVSNAKARTELGWQPSMLSYLQGVTTMASAL